MARVELAPEVDADPERTQERLNRWQAGGSSEDPNASVPDLASTITPNARSDPAS